MSHIGSFADKRDASLDQHMEELDVMASITLDAEVLLHSHSLNKLPCDKSHILVACFPKSGSTWLTEVLGFLPNFNRVHLVPMYGRREQELAFERLLLFHELNYVAQHHCRFSIATERCLSAFSVVPVILVRNIFDCVMSLKDYLDGGDRDLDRRIGPTAYVPDAYYGWSDVEKYNFIIDMIIPWYFNFFVSWQEYLGGVWVSYEEMVGHPLDTVKRISNQLNLSFSDADVQQALERASQTYTRKNVGKVGRGRALAIDQKNRIYKFASYYVSQDFSKIGV